MASGTMNVLLIVLALILFLAVWNALGPVALLISTIIALIALKIVGWLGIRIQTNIWSILVLLIGGVPGLLVLIFLSVTGIAFRGK
jgi:hypothetical protein